MSKLLTYVSICFAVLLSGCALDFEKFPSDPSNASPDQAVAIDMAAADMMIMMQIDSDDDGVFDRNDNCPGIANETQEDVDGDGAGDACDDDIDGDGVENEVDLCPRNSDPLQTDQDADGLGNACDDDVDGDGVLNADDSCVFEPNPNQTDLDRDGIADACDDDRDNDGLNDEEEVRLGTDPLRADTDADGVSDRDDKCPLMVDPTNTDADGDGLGRVCDIDDDGDGVFDFEDNCLGLANAEQSDADGDRVGDDCADDFDGDGVLTAEDNCPQHPNSDQSYRPCESSLTAYHYDRSIRDLMVQGNETYITTNQTIRRIQNGTETQIVSNFLSSEISPIAIFPKSNGQILVLSESDLLVYDEARGLQFSLMGLEAPEGFGAPFTAMAFYNEQVWVGNNNGLFRLNDEGWQPVAEVDQVTQLGGSVVDVVVGPQSRLWVLFEDSAAIFEGDTMLCGENLACPDLPMDVSAFRGFSLSGADHVWIYSNVGAERYNFNGVLEDAFRGPEVFGLAGEEDLWVLSSINLYRVDRDRRSLPEVKANLPASLLSSISAQPGGSFLVGSVNGIREYESFLTTLSDEGLPPGVERFGSCVVDGLRANDQLWVASNDRITVIAPDGTDRILRSAELLNQEMPDEGLEISVMRLIDNNVWIGTNRGISVIGTSELTVTNTYQQQLPNATVTDIVVHAPTNTVWVSTLGGGIAYLKPDGTWPRVTQLEDLRSDTVNALAVSNDTVYAATQGGPSAINPSTGSVSNTFNFGNELAEQNESALDIYFDQPTNRLFVATSNGLAVRTNTTWEIFQRVNGGLPLNSDTDMVRAVNFDGEYIWMLLGRGIDTFPNGSLVRRRANVADTGGLLQLLPEDIGLPATDSANAIRLNIYDGEFFISTCGRSGQGEIPGGLSLLTQNNLEINQFSQDSLVGSSSAESRLLSGFDGVPLSTGLNHEGIYQSEEIKADGLAAVSLPLDVFQAGPTACADDPSRSGATVCIFPRTPAQVPPAGGIGLRFETNGSYQWSTTGADTFTALRDGDLRDIGFDATNVAWVISRQGLVKYEASGTRISLVNQATDPGLLSDDILSLAIDGNTLALGTQLGLIFYKPHSDQDERWLSPTGLGDVSGALPVRALAFDDVGRLFFGTDDGLYLVSSTREYVREYTSADGLLSNNIKSIAVMSSGQIYVGTSGGLSVLDDTTDTFKSVIIGDLLGGTEVYDLFEAADGHLWFRTAAGVGRLNP